MEKGCNRLSSDLEIGTSHSLASRLPYNPERMIKCPAATLARRRRASGADHRLKVVGKTAYGAVIGTGAYRLLDGSSIRTPGTGLWNVKGYNLENYGVPPDVDVDNTPADFLAGRDAQLEKAVEVLKEEMQKKPETKTAQAAN